MSEQRVGRLIALGGVTIVAFDIVASLASRAIGFRYGLAAVGSWFIYAIFGYLIGRRGSVSAAAFGVAIIGGVEATIGWAVSWMIGPVGVPTRVPGIGEIISTIVIIELIGALIGALAGWVARRKAPAALP